MAHSDGEPRQSMLRERKGPDHDRADRGAHEMAVAELR